MYISYINLHHPSSPIIRNLQTTRITASSNIAIWAGSLQPKNVSIYLHHQRCSASWQRGENEVSPASLSVQLLPRNEARGVNSPYPAIPLHHPPQLMSEGLRANASAQGCCFAVLGTGDSSENSLVWKVMLIWRQKHLRSLSQKVKVMVRCLQIFEWSSLQWLRPFC